MFNFYFDKSIHIRCFEIWGNFYGTVAYFCHQDTFRLHKTSQVKIQCIFGVLPRKIQIVMCNQHLF